jgi:hypothetical protein
LAIEQPQEFLVQPVDASWLQCNIECQEACPVGTNCRGYLNLAAEGRFEEGYILSRDPNPVAAMCSYVCSAPCERACRRGDIDRPLAIRAMKRFLVEWHEASGIPDVMPQITPRAERVAVVGAGPAGISVARELATKGYQVTVFDSLPYGGGTMLIGVPAFRLPREAIEMDDGASGELVIGAEGVRGEVIEPRGLIPVERIEPVSHLVARGLLGDRLERLADVLHAEPPERGAPLYGVGNVEVVVILPAMGRLAVALAEARAVERAVVHLQPRVGEQFAAGIDRVRQTAAQDAGRRRGGRGDDACPD